MSREEAFEGFVNQAFLSAAGEVQAASSENTGSHLKGADKKLYDFLKPLITDVANGERTSTVFTVSVADVGLDQSRWTAQDLGIESFIDENYYLTEEGQAALQSQLYDFNKVITSLLWDCPYELYWFDKMGGFYEGMFGIGAEWNQNNDLVLYFQGTADLSLVVSGEYAADTFEVDPATGTTVSAAAAKALSVVQDYKDYSDLDKLWAYKERICGMVSYNYAAAQNPNTPFGNPWQLIWVFDDDPNTNVVCEGYAKAFQYLFDMSSFSAPLKCRLASGPVYMDGDGGGHMWNIVTRENGRNYLVDVTNCDEDSIGDPDLLYMVPADSGDFSSGYSFFLYDVNMYYTYDYDTINYYTEEELTLSLRSEEPQGQFGGDEFLTLPLGYDVRLPELDGFGGIQNIINYSPDTVDIMPGNVLHPITPGTARIIVNYCDDIYFSYSLSVMDSGSFAFLPYTERIEEEAFANDLSLEYLNLGKGISYIGNNAFTGSGLKEIIVLNKDTEFSADAFEGLMPVIICYEGSTAETFAKRNGFPCMLISSIY